MRTALRLCIGSLVVCAALVPGEVASAFAVTGDSLALDQRDVRIFDNFTYPGLHENQLAHPNWPGYLEVELALWKAAAEWGSRPFGNGTGDPLQSPVGSGGAAFDFFWNGEANGIGNTNDNIVSQIAGSGGGVCAFLELPSTDGWRVRIYGDCALNDGPGDIPIGQIDFQGVLTHELGHALGLAHSTVSGATMFPVGPGNLTPWRSIEPDDQAGVQFVYGARNDLFDPRVDAIAGSTQSGGTAVLLGNAFAATGNEIWFNNDLLDGGAPGGEPTKLTNLSSTAGGTQISFTVPASGVESGALHVRSLMGGREHVSEGQPFALGGTLLDTLRLDGDTVGNVGSSVSYTIAAGPPHATFALLWSLNTNGAVILGHAFDLGPPITIATSGSLSSTGDAVWTSGPLPPQASGQTVFLEAGARALGSVFDSNVVALQVN